MNSLHKGKEMGQDLTATKPCKECGKEKNIFLDFPFSNPNGNICKKCRSQKEKLRRHKTFGMRPENHWKYKRFGPGPNLKEVYGQENTENREGNKKVSKRLEAT